MLDEEGEEESELALGEDDPVVLRCVACGHVITRSSERISVGGQHRHVCVNPRGIAYDIGCFRRAPGLAIDGLPMTSFSWFEGYAWQVANCGGCGIHLGWWFTGAGPDFAGLVVRRLTEE